MKILFVPDYTEVNPYQLLLKNHLEKRGGIVTCVNEFPLKKIILKKAMYNILHVHWTRQFFDTRNRFEYYKKLIKSIIRLIVLRCCGVSIVWTVHNLYNHDSHYQKNERFFNVILIALAKQVIVHSPICKEKFLTEFKNRGKKKIAVIPHGHYIGAYRNDLSRDEARKTLGFQNGDKVILSLGNVRPYKGLQSCITAFKQLKDKSAQLLIVGKSITEDFSAQLIQECSGDTRIRLILKYIMDDDLQLYLNASDVMVLPFQNIFTSGSLILGMSFGKAIIAPQIGSIPDYVNEKGAFLYDPNTGNGLACAMERSMIDHKRLSVMGEINFMRAKELDWNFIGENTMQVYKNVSENIT